MPSTIFADQIFPGAKIITASLSVSNISGSYSTTVSDDRMTGSMKAIALEIADPSVFNGKITVNATAGQYTFSCPDVAGSTTVVISFIKTADDPTQLTSAEFDVLNNRIGDLTTLTTTAKTSAVAAINEVNSKKTMYGTFTTSAYGASGMPTNRYIALSAYAEGYVLVPYLPPSASEWFVRDVLTGNPYTSKDCTICYINK